MTSAISALAKTMSTAVAISFAARHCVLVKPACPLLEIGMQYLLGVAGQKSMNLNAQPLEMSLPLPR